MGDITIIISRVTTVLFWRFRLSRLEMTSEALKRNPHLDIEVFSRTPFHGQQPTWLGKVAPLFHRACSAESYLIHATHWSKFSPLYGHREQGSVLSCMTVYKYLRMVLPFVGFLLQVEYFHFLLCVGELPCHPGCSPIDITPSGRLEPNPDFREWPD